MASDGGIFNFGDAAYYGSTGNLRLNKPVVGMAATPDGRGYWLAASDGGIFTFGDAPFRGSTGGIRLNQPIVGLAVAHSANPYVPGARGYDISWPQCGSAYPPAPYSVAVVGVNDGRAFTDNPCLASEANWARQGSPSLYININAPPSSTPDGTDQSGPAGTCGAGNLACLGYNYGYNTAVRSVAYANASGASGSVWWLDVELVPSAPGYWTADQGFNAQAIAGAIGGLQGKGLTVGIYSTPYQWGQIAGGYSPRLPLWEAGAPTSNPAAYCSSAYSFGGGQPWLTQDVSTYDGDYAC
ncbi:MAG: hypothetical protein DLM54_08785 [Acidimicrobiales bacterium]|nr:MAG: hypothetical protein DLM54_08785 [Acidimicrobiales bacterium]